MIHTVKTADGDTKTFDPYSAVLAIRCMCTECLGWETDPKNCTSPTCPLFPYRRRTNRTKSAQNREISPEKRAAIADRFKRAREKLLDGPEHEEKPIDLVPELVIHREVAQ